MMRVYRCFRYSILTIHRSTCRRLPIIVRRTALRIRPRNRIHRGSRRGSALSANVREPLHHSGVEGVHWGMGGGLLRVLDDDGGWGLGGACGD
jgi:hypothetical protein